jgi:hypothetical protein
MKDLNGMRWNRNEVNIDVFFSYNIALYVKSNNENRELKSIKVIDNEDIYK